MAKLDAKLEQFGLNLSYPQVFMNGFNSLIVATLIVCAVGGSSFFKWYYAAPDMPGTISNAKVATIMNGRLAEIIKNMTPERFPGLSEKAADSAKSFLTTVRSVTQHCNYKRPQVAHNKIVFDMELAGGAIVRDLYNGGWRCPRSDVPGIPIMRILFKDGLVSEVFTDGSERSILPKEIIPTIDQLIKNIISYDMEINKLGYYKNSPTKTDLEKAWSGD